MKKLICIISSLLLIIVLIGLSPEGLYAVNKSDMKQFPRPNSDKALVYLIRPNNFFGSARTEFVYSDQTFLGTLDNKTYTYAYVDPGYHLIWTNWTSVQKDMEFVAGQTYYLEIFQHVTILNEKDGSSLIQNKIPNFATPTDKERQKAVSQIQKRYSRAVKKMKKEDYAPLVAEKNGTEESMPVSGVKEGAVLLPSNTLIKLRLLENVTSFYNKTGDEILFQVIDDVNQEGQKMIAAKTPVKGLIRYISDGKTGGTAGSLDIVISSIPAVDGTEVPMIGQLSKTGNDRSEQSVLARGVLLGAFGVLSMKSRQAYLLAPEVFEVKTRADTWIMPPSPSPADTPLTLAPTPVEIPQALPTTTIDLDKPIRFKPHSKKNLSPVEVTLPIDWSSLELKSIENFPLPNTVKAVTQRQKGSNQIFVFNGWDIVRYLPIMENKPNYQLNFLGQKQGQNTEVVVPIQVVVKAK